MEKFNLCEGLVAHMLEMDAWKELSGNFKFNESQLEKYANELDWEELSHNSEIFWTVSMLEKFKGRIHWGLLSVHITSENLSIELLEKFKDRWDWDEISERRDLTIEIIDKFANLINWRKLINNYYAEKWASFDFVKKYEDKIPAGEFKDSRLWRELSELKAKELQKKICFG